MPLALILSSYVAGSRVGGMAQALALAPFKVDPVVAPTVLFGRHPGWGPPGGGAVGAQTFRGVVEGVESNGLLALTDVLITGYFASAEQVWIAAEAIDRAREATRDPRAYGSRLTVIVDPIMGDADKGLYVKEEVAQAIALDLVPRADILTPNVWELSQLTGLEADYPRDIAQIARTLDKPVLVTSVPVEDDDQIGVLYVDRGASLLASHARLPDIPRGTGDLMTALFGAAMVEGLAPHDALYRAVQGVAETAEACVAWKAFELPIVALGERLARPTASVRIETLS
ncbi:bifunctional hydroxymethylpyrimidine kinase/phosphomethylpyrimidine kinase [Caulobacter sp. 17J65-9]|uniref:bifunctional hydroxymethylpyrimidine kinase/phosphomethylpyrimidine kinase n=1 Tax=Caulobacter sp. 17J65-9 TaxID=2709382 RepID=UPI0013C653FC|nr:bifunctional hydroxymethylpyrimidine kinase/phosphomethylpyrimidine kinase [Caulobacter sp. 17J65-9]NEX92997.1 pyridoxine kinase [Caulobacter sp. 17J65-9]